MIANVRSGINHVEALCGLEARPKSDMTITRSGWQCLWQNIFQCEKIYIYIYIWTFLAFGETWHQTKFTPLPNKKDILTSSLK